MLQNKKLFHLLILAAAMGQLASQPASARDRSVAIVDHHVHLRVGEADWTISPSQPRGLETIGKQARKAGITRTGLVVVATGGPQTTKERNDALLAAVATDPQHYFAIASVHPADGLAALEEIDRLVRAGVRHLKFHPNSQEFDPAGPEFAAVLKKANEHRMILLVDCFNPMDRNHFSKLMMVALKNPQARFILAHMNMTDFRETASIGLLRKMRQAENIYFDLSVIASTYANSPLRQELVWTMRTIGMDRMIFGSDWPFNTPEEALKAVQALKLSSSEQRQVLGENALLLMQSAR